MKEEGKILFYINRKLASNQFKEVLEGIREARDFVLEVKSLGYLNTIVMSLLDLFCTAKLSFVRIQVANILKNCHKFINQLTSKAQMASVLQKQKCLKSNDQIIRILSLEIISSLNILFHKDTSVYHSLLSKLKFRHQVSIKQQVSTIKCLCTLLANSEYLSTIFSNNIIELEQLGGIQGKIIVYLCLYAKFDSAGYSKILEDVWTICKRDQNRQNKRYYEKLIVKACRINYLAIEYYKKEHLDRFPKINLQIEKIIQISYNFLKNENAFIDGDNLTDENLLDLCYEHFQVYDEIDTQLQQIIVGKIKQNLDKNHISMEIFLLSFYLEKSTKQHFEIQMLKRIQYNSDLLKILKICLVCGCFRLALQLCELIFNKPSLHKYVSAIVLLQTYAQLHVQLSIDKLEIFLTVLSNIAKYQSQKNLQNLCKKWKSIYEQNVKGHDTQLQVIKAYQTNMEVQQVNLPPSMNLIKQNPVSNLNSINPNQNQVQYEEDALIIKCSQQLQRTMEIGIPISMRGTPFSLVFFGKRTILDILKFL